MEEKIVSLLKKQDFKGLELLIDMLGTDILKTIHAILNRPEEDSYQKETENEVFYKIWQKIQQFDSRKSSLKTWTLTIVRNTCIDKKRSILKKQDVLPLELVSNYPTYDHPLEKVQFLELIDSLTQEDQLIFLSYYFYQETPQQIAERLRMDVSQIYNRLSRGRKRLKTVLEKEGNHGQYF